MRASIAPLWAVYYRGAMRMDHIPEDLIAGMADRGLTSAVIRRTETDRLPPDRGAYLLMLGLPRRTLVSRGRQGTDVLAKGWYIYAGNAYGPGGIKARVSRHFRRHKPRHWHIDHLTDKAALYAMTFPEQTECALVARLTGHPGFAAAAAGFGSSDCRTCESHLLAWRSDLYQPGSMP